METLESMVEKARANQFKATSRPPDMVRLIVNDGDVIISPTTVVSNNIKKDAIIVMPKDIENFKEFKTWADKEYIPTYCQSLDEYHRNTGIVLWDGMPLKEQETMVIRLDVEMEASGEDIMSILLRYYFV